MKTKSAILVNFLLMFSLFTGMVTTPAIAGENLQVPAPDRPAPPDCDLLDDRRARGLISGALETKLMVECGRVPERVSPETQGESLLAPLAGDVLVNNPTTDVGLSTTQSETSIAVNSTTGTICSAYNDSQHYAVGGIAFMGFSSSTDGGATFVDHGPFPAGGGGNGFGDPSLVWRQSDGYFYYAALHSFGLGLWRSTDDCQSFTYLSMIHVGVADDKELMAVDNNPASPYYGRLYVAWTDFTTAHIYVSYSDTTTSWSAPVDVSLKVDVQGAWPAVDPVTNDVYVAWVHWDSYPGGPIDVEIVRSTNGGGSFGFVTNPLNNAVNPRDSTATVNCGRPALKANLTDGLRYLPSPQIVVGPDGALHVVYVKDPDGYDTGDVINAYYRRSTDNGATWGAEVLLNDDGTTTDQFFPSLSVGPTNVVVASWYDRRNDTLNNYLFDRYKAFSGDGGLTWNPNLRVSDVSSAIPQLNPNFDPVVVNCYHGDYDQQVQDGDYVYIQWSDDRNIQNSHPDPDIFFEKELALIEFGTLTGQVYDANTMAPIPGGANISAIGMYDFFGTTNASGIYTMTVAAGTYDVTASAFAYQPGTAIGVSVIDGGTTVQDFALDLAPTVSVSGYVYDTNTGWPLYASLEVAGAPLPFWSDPLTGYYEIQVPTGGTFDFHVNAWVPGYSPADLTLGPVAGNTSQDFPLDVSQSCNAPGYSFKPIYQENFEGGLGNWTLDGLWNSESESDTCGLLVAPFPSPTTAAYYGQDGICNYDTGVVNSGSLTMVTPVLLSSDVSLNFSSYEQTECGGDCVFDNRYVDISTDGGATWSNLGEGNTEGEWYQRRFDLSAYTGQNALFRFLFNSADLIANSYFGWMVDDVTVGSCLPPASGSLVVGNVYDNNTLIGLNGATVSDEDGYSTTAVATPLDPNVADGFYTLFSSAASPPTVQALKHEIPASNGDFPRGEAEPSFGPASANGVAVVPPEQVLAPVPMRTSAYSYETLNSYLTLFDLSVPEVLPNLNSFPSVDFPGAGEFVDGYTYIITGTSTLSKYDQYGNFVSSLPVTPLAGSQSYTGMTVDPTDGTVFASSCDISSSFLYTFDLNTGTASQIGQITGSPCTIAIAVDGAGDMYGHDIVNNSLIGINKATGAGTVIGLLGFDANYGQGMDWDPLTDTLYLAAFNNSTSRGELRVADRSTGATALVGPLGQGTPGGLVQLPFLGVMEEYNKVLTAEKPIYVPDTEVVDVPNYSTFGQDFYLEAGQLAAAPDSLTATVVIGYNDTLQMTLDNSGTMPAPFSVIEHDAGFSLPVMAPNQAGDGDYPLGEAAPSFGEAPGIAAGAPPLNSPLLLPLGTLAYALEVVNGFFTQYDLAGPEVLPNLANFQTLSFPGAGEYVDGYIYVNDSVSLYKLDTTGDVLGEIPITALLGGHTYTGMAHDPTDGTLYLSSCNISNSYLYTLDVATGTATQIGEITGSPCTIAIAVDGAGDMYGHDIVNDDLISINKTTGASNSIGPLGYDANFGQGMGWDAATDTLYLAAFNLSSFQAELRIADRSTGSTSLVGVLGQTVPSGLTQLPFLAIPLGVDVPWLSEDPITGTITAGDSQLIDVNFDASVPEVTGPGTYEALLSIISDTPYGALQIPVTMNVVPVQHGVDAALEQDAQSGTPGTTVTYRAVITNTGNVSDSFDITISGNTWTTTAPVTTGPLAPEESTVVEIDVMIPPGAQGGATDSSTMTLTSQGDPSESASVMMTTTAIYLYGLDAILEQDAQTGTPGTTVTYRANITNTGNATDTFDITISGNSWTTTAPVTGGPLVPGEIAIVDIDVLIPPGVLDGATDNATVTFTSQGDPSESTSVVTATTAIYLKVYLPTITKT